MVHVERLDHGKVALNGVWSVGKPRWTQYWRDRSRLRGVCMIYDKPADDRLNLRGSKAKPNIWFTNEWKIVGACVKVESHIK